MLEEGEAVVSYVRTLSALVVFPLLHPLEGGCTSDEFLGELGLVLISTGAVDFLVGIARLVEAEHCGLVGSSGSLYQSDFLCRW